MYFSITASFNNATCKNKCWGSLEPFDDSMPEILKESGVYTHLVSDH